MTESEKLDFYMQLSYILLTKFCYNHIAIAQSEWEEIITPYRTINIAHRLNEHNVLEVMAVAENQS